MTDYNVEHIILCSGNIIQSLNQDVTWAPDQDLLEQCKNLKPIQNFIKTEN